MNDFKWQILEVLMSNKKPMRAYHIAKALNKTSSHVEYHLKSLIDEGRVVCFNEEGTKRYTTQQLLQSKKVEDDFSAVIAGAIPNLLCYMDLSCASDKTEAFINNVRDLLHKVQRDLEKSISKNF
jgi:DNA-binding transcriptional ArsR family regulator